MKFPWYFKNRESWSSSFQKNDKMIVYSMEYHIYWSLKISCFGIFEDTKYSCILSPKVDGKMIFTDYWKGLFQAFGGGKYSICFDPKNWLKDGIYLVYWALTINLRNIFDLNKYLMKRHSIKNV